MATDDSAVFGYFLGLLAQIKMHHWCTLSYAKHKALDELHETLSEKVDLFIESWMGRLKKQPVLKLSVELPALEGDATAKVDKYIEAERDRVLAMSAKSFAKAPELQNVLEDIATAMDQSLYLFKLS
jgi:hypothetical protein